MLYGPAVVYSLYDCRLNRVSFLLLKADASAPFGHARALPLAACATLLCMVGQEGLRALALLWGARPAASALPWTAQVAAAMAHAAALILLRPAVSEAVAALALRPPALGPARSHATGEQSVAGGKTAAARNGTLRQAVLLLALVSLSHAIVVLIDTVLLQPVRIRTGWRLVARGFSCSLSFISLNVCRCVYLCPSVLFDVSPPIFVSLSLSLSLSVSVFHAIRLSLSPCVFLSASLYRSLSPTRAWCLSLCLVLASWNANPPRSF